MPQVIKCLAVLLLIKSCSTLVPTTECVAKAKAGIRSLIEANSVHAFLPEYPFIGGFVRLVFHDCAGPGGCDGCIDHKNPGTAGLKRYTDKLDHAYIAGGHNCMSRADFYALAAMVALEKGTETVHDKFTALANGRFLVGRRDCSTSPNEDADDGPLPDGKFNTDQTLEFFQTAFGLSAQEIVALIGSHTLGRCSVKNTGYEGKWVSGFHGFRANSDILDNRFYTNAAGIWWQVTVPGSGKLQWQRPLTPPNSGNENRFLQPTMFLNSDLSLAWNLDPLGPKGKVHCRIGACIFGGCCPKAETNAIFKEYAASNALWLRDFTNVFLKMINVNGAKLQHPKAARKDFKKDHLPNEADEIIPRRMSDYIPDQVNDFVQDQVNEYENDQGNEYEQDQMNEDLQDKLNEDEELQMNEHVQDPMKANLYARDQYGRDPIKANVYAQDVYVQGIKANVYARNQYVQDRTKANEYARDVAMD